MKKETLRLLIVDDSVLVVERIKNLLSGVEGISILGYPESAKKALQLVKDANPDVILLDINLPDESGIDFLKMIKKKFPKISVIMLTNFSGDHYREVCKKHGADYFFDKSFEFEGIIPALAELMKRTIF
ncbi:MULTISPECIES: response regulator transcription factor [unclassified Imperialibacter]|uniref:response regulator n=1 Tax=unclassified Imperialibacter TaxID=2629706 RepID=UPI00125AEA1D|nr:MULTISPECIES: response regulator transcription factor [unclassified Imperialibacter]CAD5277167.1 Response regulator [Imperialibacter sp. 75]CAD5295148.1 Response regulator [Imperialibacter sp. 89]VVT12214.1 conserved hypothetical protein [Imperialibacter sp. EC-SDR9]